jgi:hypothetical protein
MSRGGRGLPDEDDDRRMPKKFAMEIHRLRDEL